MSLELPRRSFLGGLGLIIAASAAPAIVRAHVLMPISPPSLLHGDLLFEDWDFGRSFGMIGALEDGTRFGLRMVDEPNATIGLTFGERIARAKRILRQEMEKRARLINALPSLAEIGDRPMPSGLFVPWIDARFIEGR